MSLLVPKEIFFRKVKKKTAETEEQGDTLLCRPSCHFIALSKNIWNDLEWGAVLISKCHDDEETTNLLMVVNYFVNFTPWWKGRVRGEAWWKKLVAPQAAIISRHCTVCTVRWNGNFFHSPLLFKLMHKGRASSQRCTWMYFLQLLRQPPPLGGTCEISKLEYDRNRWKRFEVVEVVWMSGKVDRLGILSLANVSQPDANQAASKSHHSCQTQVNIKV